VDLDFVLRAFANGMEGVFIGGCRLNECNYTTHGNYHALNMVLLCRRIMEHVGLNPERLRIAFMSSGEGNLFVEEVNAFTRKVKELGPIGESDEVDPDGLRERLREVRELVPYIKVREREKLNSRLTSESEYEKLFALEEVERLLREVASYHIDPERCRACGICARRCPAEAIEGGKNRIHVIDQEKCIKCGTCLEACPDKFSAVQEIQGGPVPPPIPEEERTIERMARAR
jgi:coenzyme F420-reducing hydrogenase delta subunit/ferredoxin